MSFVTSKQNRCVRKGTKICVYVVRVTTIKYAKTSRFRERARFRKHALFYKTLFDIPVA